MAQRATYRAPEYNAPPFWRISQGSHLLFPISPKNTNLVEDVEILLPVKFPWIPFRCFRGQVENVSANHRPGRPSWFPISPKNTKFLEDVENSLPVKCRWIKFNYFRGEVENVAANQWPGRPFCFSDRPEKYKLGRRGWDIASCQVSFHSVRRFRGEVKNVSANLSQDGHLVFPVDQKNTNLVEDVENLLPVKFPWILFSGVRGEVVKM